MVQTRRGCWVSTSSKPALAIGTTVSGKWNRRTYMIERLLGEGANGRVYLARRGRQRCAVKVGFNALDLQSEINALKTLAQHSARLRDYFIEADDFEYKGRDMPFYAMAYVQGKTLDDYIAEHGRARLMVLARQLLERLAAIHRSGYIFGDLKRDNVLVTAEGVVELIDFGGVTRKGNAVRQFTEIYDRGFWELGSRTADESYDLFAFAVLVMQTLDPEKELDTFMSALPQHRNRDTLLEILQRCGFGESAKAILQALLEGKIHTSEEAWRLWRTMLLDDSGHRPVRVPGKVWLRSTLVASMLLFALSMYLVLQ